MFPIEGLQKSGKSIRSGDMKEVETIDKEVDNITKVVDIITKEVDIIDKEVDIIDKEVNTITKVVSTIAKEVTMFDPVRETFRKKMDPGPYLKKWTQVLKK